MSYTIPLRPTLLFAAVTAAALFPPAEAAASCTNPYIAAGTITQTSIEIKYDDECSNETSTKVYGRKGTTGAATLLRTDPAYTSGIRTVTHGNLEPGTQYCYYIQTIRSPEPIVSQLLCVNTQPLSCGPPTIIDFPAKNATSITVRYSDECVGEDWTRVYARKGMSGSFTEIEYDPKTTDSAPRTTVHDGLDPSTTYCFYAKTSVLGVQKSSATKCTDTTEPACLAPIFGSPAFTQILPDTITIQYDDRCSSEQNTTVWGRPQSSSTWTALHTEGKKSGWRTFTHANLTPETAYCYVVSNTGPDGYTSYSGQFCAGTPVAFSTTAFTRAEADRVWNAFSWQKAPIVSEGPLSSPHVYYVNLLLPDDETAQMLRELGAHVEGTPLFSEEVDGFDESATVFDDQGAPVGRWYFAALPGQMFNAFRTEALQALDRGDEPFIRAMVLRRIPVSAARNGSLYRLSLQYLGEQGFEHNEIRHCFIDPNFGEVCQTSQELLGWLAYKLVSFGADAFHAVRQGVRNVIGQIVSQVKGEIDLEVSFTVRNTDPAFARYNGSARIDVMKSGWRGTPIVPKNLIVRARQGLAQFTGTTDDDGRVTIKIAKNRPTRICLQLENDYIFLTESMTSKIVCLGNVGSFSTDASKNVEVIDDFVNVFLQMTDTAEYVRTVMGYEMPKITALVGGAADLVSNDGRPFAPCMGRMPNLLLGGGQDLVAALVAYWFPHLLLVTTANEFYYSVDVVLPSEFGASRGVATHEYAHVVMCSMMGLAAQVAWTEVLLQSATRLPDGQASYIAEAFADLITSQVAGGTRSFATTLFHPSLGVNYSFHGTDSSGNATYGLDDNFTESPDPEFEDQVRRVASLMHDLFDGHSGTDKPNDGVHWATSNPIVHEGVGNSADANDEPIAMRGQCMQNAFTTWRAVGDTLAEDTFLRALAITAYQDGYSVADICSVFADHSETGTCPSWVMNLSGPPGGVRCSAESGSGGSGGNPGGNEDDPGNVEN